MIAKGKSTIETRDNAFIAKRVFNAPPQVVFDVYTQPEHIPHWWGLEASKMIVCDVDLTVGGAWRYATREEDGSEVAFGGEYREITPPSRIVYTEFYDVPEYRDTISLVTVDFTAQADGGTLMTMQVDYPSAEVLEMVLQTGMADGMEISFSRLDARLDTLQQGNA